MKQAHTVMEAIPASQIFDNSIVDVCRDLSSHIPIFDQIFQDVFLYGLRGDKESNDFYMDYKERLEIWHLYHGLRAVIITLNKHDWFKDVNLPLSEVQQIEAFFDGDYSIVAMLKTFEQMAMVSALYVSKSIPVTQEDKENSYYTYTQLRLLMENYIPPDRRLTMMIHC